MTVNHARHGAAPAGRLLRNRWIPFTAAATAVVLTAAAIAAAGGGAAGASAPLQAQSVGNFVDAAVDGHSIDPLVNLAYAHAASPGTESVQNPLDVTALNAIHLPLTGALQLPNLAGITLGADNQVAVANHDGSSYGASGLVQNSGGVSIGGDNQAFPSDASVDLCASALSGGNCSSGPSVALGELKLTTGAVSGLASTPKGYGKPGSTQYQIASLGLQLGAPQLGALLGQVTSTLSGALSQVTTQLGPINTLLDQLFPASCTLTSGSLPTSIPLPGGVGAIDVANATINIDLAQLVDLNHLPANTDLVKYLVTHLAGILTQTLTSVVGGLVTTLETAIGDCLTDLGGLSAVGLPALLSTLQGVVTTVTGTLGGVLAPITDAVAPLLDAVSGLVDIGINVQPNGAAGDFDTGLDATPKQGTAVVAGQTIVRAIEVDVLSTGGHPLVALALGNAAAGPSAAPTASSSSPPPSASPSTSAPATNIPTGVPAGMGTHGGDPALPITLLGLALMFAAGGAVAFKMRGRLNSH